jgi:hypothetical protein
MVLIYSHEVYMSSIDKIIPGYNEAKNGVLEISSSKALIVAGWNHVPHLTEEAKKELVEGELPHIVDARSKGIPALGAGAIYPVAEDRILCDPFEIPDFWPRAYALDVGWRCTAALWGAWDRQPDVVYVWAEHKGKESSPAEHAQGIRSKGDWIPGVIDPAARGRNQKDGTRLSDEYVSLGLDLSLADNSVEAGITAVYKRMTSGRLKIFNTCWAFLDEFRLYQRDEKGRIVKANDHLMDCLRYLIMSGMELAIDESQALDMPYNTQYTNANDGKNKTTGY